MPEQKPRVFHHTLFMYCNDVAPMRRFYIDLLGFEESYYRNDDEAGWFQFQSGTLQVTFTRSKDPAPILDEWTFQFSYREGTLEKTSWAIEVAYEDYDAVIERMIAAEDVVHLEDTPRTPRDGQYCFWVRDPMGTTIEIYANINEA